MAASITEVNYDNALNASQQNVYEILTNDSTVTTNSTYGTLNIMDGLPAKFWKSRGFPYILIRTPDIEETKITQTRYRISLTVPIEIYSKQESRCRQLADAVRKSLHDNQASTIADGCMTLYRIESGSMEHFFLNGDISKPVWFYSMEVAYNV